MSNLITRGRQTVVWLTNKSGGGVVAGDVVIISSGTASAFTTTTSANLKTDVIGVVLDTSIANDADGRVCIFGYVPIINLSAAASLGDTFATHTVAKQAAPAAARADGHFGQVLGTGATPAAVLWGVPDGSAAGGAPADATYITTSANGSLSAEVVLPQLANYNPDTPPASPGTYDDEFDDDSINVAWTTPAYDASFDMLDTSANIHLSESIAHGFMLMQGKFTSDGAYDFYKGFTPTVTDPWTLVAKMTASTNLKLADYGTNSLSVRGNADNVFYELRVGMNSGNVAIRTVYANAGAAAAGATVTTSFGIGIMYLMLSHDGSKNISSFVSGDGIGWSLVESARSLSNATGWTRLAISPAGTAGQVHPIVACDFVRYFTAAKQYKIGKDV